MYSQTYEYSERIIRLEKVLNELSKEEVLGLGEFVNVSVSEIELVDFLRAVGNTHKINVSVSSDLLGIQLTHNFSRAKVIDVFVLLCKEYSLTIEQTGGILSFKKYIKRQESKDISIVYDRNDKVITVDLQADTLSSVFRKITEETGQNILYSQDLSDYLLSGYIEKEPLETTVEKIAFMNSLKSTRTADNFLLVSRSKKNMRKFQRIGKDVSSEDISNYSYEYGVGSIASFGVVDKTKGILRINFRNEPVKSVVRMVSERLNVDTYIVAPLDEAGTLTMKSDSISYESLLQRMFENTSFFYSKKNGMFCIGKKEQLSLREVRTIPLIHRSIDALDRPLGGGNQNSNYVYRNGMRSEQIPAFSNYNNSYRNGISETNIGKGNVSAMYNDRNYSNFDNYDTKIDALLSIFPKELLKGVEIVADVEQNSFVVSGDAQKVERVSAFIEEIDKPIPVILIEIMILEVSKSASITTGVEWGLGEKSVSDFGKIYPTTDLNIGAKTVNKIIGKFNGFGLFNIGKVIPNFYSKIEALETNGDVKIRSTPKLATLNGHSAKLSNGERTYYAVTRRDIIGSLNPQTTEIKNYVPIDANLNINIRPLVSGDGQITLGVRVVQSSFNNNRVDSEAPPGINSREFTSTIRVADQDIVILGGLEEKVKNDTGDGVPLLSKIPILKWFFSKRKRVDSKTKLTVLIKPTIIE